MVLHSNRSCRPYSFGQYDYKIAISERLGIPSVIFESEQVDERYYNETQINTSLKAFFEALIDKKRGQSDKSLVPNYIGL